MPKLILHFDTPKARSFELKQGINYLGRDAGNDVTIEDVSVSGAHAQIVVDGDSVTVTDLGSSNCTFIDREPIVEASLQPGQFLRLGGVEMLFEMDAPPQEVSASRETEIESVAAPTSPARIRITPIGAPVGTPPVATPGAPPLAPRIPILATAPVAFTGSSNCRFHPKALARWECPQCGQLYCDLCVNSRRVADGQGYFCRPCGVQCSPVAAPASLLPTPSDDNFYSQLPGAFLYPFKSGVGFVLVVMAVFFAVVEFVARFGFFGLIIQMSVTGYVFIYMQKVIQCTVQGEDREPPMPDVSSIFEDLVVPCLQFVGAIAFCFWPAIGLAIWHSVGGPSWTFWAIFPALALGCLYFPMAFLAMATFDSLSAMNPMVLVPAIAKIPLEYLTACICLAIVFAVRLFGAFGLKELIPIPILPALISDIIGLYFLTVQCRILGLLYYTNRDRLGWMRH